MHLLGSHNCVSVTHFISAFHLILLVYYNTAVPHIEPY